MSMTREEKKLRAYRMAERRLQRRLEDIDWVEDELKPEIEELRTRLKATVRIEIPSSLGNADQA